MRTENIKLYWQYRPVWRYWWIMIPVSGVASQRGYGPFTNEFEIQMAAEVHGVPFTGQIEGME